MMDRVRALKRPFWMTLGLVLICGGFYVFLSRGNEGVSPYIEAAETAVQRTFGGTEEEQAIVEVPLEAPLPEPMDPRSSVVAEKEALSKEETPVRVPVAEPPAEKAIEETPPIPVASFLPQIIEEKPRTSPATIATALPPCAEPASSVSSSSLPAAPVQDAGTEASGGRILIAEVSIGGAGENDRDRISLYNASAEAVDISGWRLRKRAKTGGEYSIKVLADGSRMLPGGYFIWGNAKFGNGANATSSETLAANNSVALFNKEGEMMDAVAWGEGHVTPYIEGNAFRENPKDGALLTRRTVDGKMRDSDDNRSDFEMR